MSPLALGASAWLFSVWSTVVWSLRPTRSVHAAADSNEGIVPVARALLVRPCAGAERLLEHTLGSTSEARSRHALTVRFAIASMNDAALPVAEATASRLRASGPAVADARVVITGADGPNAKADQLARVLRAEGAHDVVVVCDSDVDMAGVDLDALVAPLSSADVGAVWASPVESAPLTFGDRASAAVLSASLHAFPLLATLDRGSLVGKLFAIRAETLARVGGFDALASHLGEDMELSRLLRGAGLRVVAVDMVARSCAGGRTFAEVVARYARWIAVIRAQRPALLASYPFYFAFFLPSLVVSLVVAAREPVTGLLLALTATALRLAAAFGARTRARTGKTRGAAYVPLDALVADVVLIAAFARALGTSRVSWRGRSLRVTRGGVLVPAEARTP